jgi:ParB family chromosome partitioning protein
MRRPLGRGLDALIGDGESSVSARISDGTPRAIASENESTVLMVEPDQITVSRFQPRRVFNEAALQELADAIKSQGIVEPLIVRPGAAGTYELIAGERRLRASRLAQLDRVPVMVRSLDDRSALEISLVENLLREDLNPIEEGNAFSRLNREFAMTHDDIAGRIGKSRAYVSNMIRLTELPPEILEMVGRGRLSAGQVRPLLALKSAAEQIDQAVKIAEGRLSAREAEQIAAQRRKKPSKEAGQTWAGDPNLKAVAESIQRALKRKVQITRRRGRHPGRIEIEYYSDDDLTGLALLLVQHTT